LQAALKVGTEVITTSGIYGTITGEDDDNVLWLEIDDDVQVRIARAAIQSTVSSDDASDTVDEGEAAELDDVEAE
jgi:preprotein translocase subunit YajC